MAKKSSGSGGSGGSGNKITKPNDPTKAVQKDDGIEKSSSGTTTALNKETAQSILNLGGPLSAKTVAEKVASGEVVETKDKNGNTVFKKKVTFPTAANNWGRG